MNYNFLLIALSVVIGCGIFQDSFAELYRGDTYTDFDYGNTTHVWTGGLSPYTETGDLDSQGRKIYIHHIVDDQPTYVKVSNGAASFVFDKLTCSAKIYNGGLIENSNDFIIASDSYVPKSSLDGSGTWSIVNSVNDAPCVTTITETANSIEVTGTKTSSAGVFKVRYVKEDGKPLESFLEATNLTALTDRRFGVTQTMQIPQIISWGDQQINLENFVGQTKDRTWLENNKANLIEFSQGLKFDTLKAWDHLESVSINSVSNGLASVSFNYIRNTPILLPNETLVIDPTYSSNNPTVDGHIVTNTGGSTCSTTASSKDTSSTTANAILGITASDCSKPFFEWDTTSIPDNSDVTDTDMVFQGTIFGIGNVCDAMPMTASGRPSTASNQNILDDINNGTPYNASFCSQGTGNNKVVDLGTSADTDVENLLSSNWFAVGGNPTGTKPGSSAQGYQFCSEEGACTPDPTLQITYTITQVYVVDLLDIYESSSTTLGSGTAKCLDVDLESANSCNSTLVAGHTYRFEVEVDNTGTGAGSPTSFEFQDVVATSDVLGSITAGAVPSAGCSTNTNWTPTISTNDLILTSGTTCSISASGNQEFWFIVTLDSDLANGTGLFYVTDGTTTDTSTTTTFSSLSFQIDDLIVENVGDAVSTTGNMTINYGNLVNVTSIVYSVNGTTITTNSTGQNTTSYPTTINFGPFYYQQTTDSVYAHAVTVIVQTDFESFSVNATNLLTREYDPDYFTALDPTQGLVNYTFSDNNFLKVNRDTGGSVFNIECQYFTQAQAFFNDQASGTWVNETNVLYYNNDASGYYYAQCFNDGELFIATINQNFSNALVPGLVIFDELGGFFGAPSIILVILAILSLGTGRNYPIILLIAASVTGILLALELLVLDPGLVVALVVMAGIGIFGIRKFY